MPIKSYLAHPHDGKYKELLSELSNIPECDIIPSKNEEIAIVITDTKDDFEDQNLQIVINSIKSLKMLSMVSGFETNQ
jgi:nitrate reductase NapAB chaperone NapD